MKSLLTLLSLLIITCHVYGHSDPLKSRYVSATGHDQGECSQVLRPCKTILYAVQQANKGDKVLVSAGSYHINTSDELFSLNSSLVSIYGGYNRFDHFQTQSPQNNITRLINIPSELAQPLREKGFSVIADEKAFTKNTKVMQKIAQVKQLNQSQPSAECVNGKAGIFDCNNVDLLGHLSLEDMSSTPLSANDVWGHIDLNTGKEYALVGIINGTIVVDVSSPENPVEVGTIPGVETHWRDIKVYQYYDHNLNLWQAYAYVTNEPSLSNTTDAVVIINLNDLPHSVSIETKSTIVASAHNVYISNIDHSLNIALPNQTPSLQIVGSSLGAGAFHSYSLATPYALETDSNTSFGSGYTHDGSSITINDSRASTNCENATQNCTVFIDFNEKEMKLWDITDPYNVERLSTIDYEDVSFGSKYVHSGWATEDKNFVLLHDEFDEKKGGLNTTVRIFSIEDLQKPKLVGQWTGSTEAMDHNGYVRGNRYYMSTYSRGLTVLDISNPENPQEIGFFDSFIEDNRARSSGAWGTYPFLPSGNILLSNIGSGLYILKDNTKTSAQGQFSFETNEITVAQNNMLTVNVNRMNTGENPEPTSIDYEILTGSALQDDITIHNGTLNWNANDITAKQINVDIFADDSGEELNESFFIRLLNPTNTATLGQHHYLRINTQGIADKGAASLVQKNIIIPENTNSFTVDVSRTGGTSGKVSYQYELVSVEAQKNADFQAESGTISWEDGENAIKTININITNDELSEENEAFTLVLSSVDNSRLGSISSVEITIADDENNEAPTIVLSENFQANTSQAITLTANASDNENDPMVYLWEQTSGSPVSLSGADSESARFTAPENAGSLTFQFTATDFRQASTTQEITVSVIAPTVVETAQASNSSNGGGGTVYWLLLACFRLMYSNNHLNKR